jgi:hypothetical protein
MVRGKSERFRLVGMDHFNAMFEDATTKSWWRQATGEAVAGKRKGVRLPEVLCQQMTLDQWFALYPGALVMQPDPEFVSRYDTMGLYDVGRGGSHLTRTDTTSWAEKSWVVGIEVGDLSKAYGWSRLLSERVIHDSLGSHHLVLVLAPGDQGFAVFERRAGQIFEMRGDTLISDSLSFDLAGQGIHSRQALKPVKAYQEFWHSWRTFHPGTTRY